MKTTIFFLFLFIITHDSLLAQQNNNALQIEALMKIATPTSTKNWVNIKAGIKIETVLFFSQNKLALGLGTDDEMRLYKKNTDGLGFTHYRYQQFSSGYRVIGGDYIIHEKDGAVNSANGRIIEGISKSVQIGVNKNNAFENAKSFFGAKSYAWQSTVLEAERKKILNDNKATYYPTGEIIWISVHSENDNSSNSFILAYMFDMYSADLSARRFYISVSSGKLIKTEEIVFTCSPTTVNSNFNGNVNISTKQVSGIPSTYNLWNDCSSTYAHTRKWNVDLDSATEYTSNNNTWASNSSAATSQWGIETAINYYSSVYARTGWNGAGGGVDIYQDALFCYSKGCVPNSPDNASFGSGVMFVGSSGNPSTIDDWNSLDIIAHEFTHGVTGSSAALVYEKEPGALNESFSDIFGVSCYAWYGGLNTNTWLIGYDRKNPLNTAQSLYIRNMSNPNEKNQPDTYHGVYWQPTFGMTAADSSDYFGVHTNSGVQNYMYYLLVSGGSGSNDNGTSFSVSGIGISNAQAIAYRALTVYLMSSSQYADARNAWVHAATDLFGECSNVAIQTGKAWYAVGFNPPLAVTNNVCGGPLGNTASYYLSKPGAINVAPNCTTSVNTIGNQVTLLSGTSVIMYPGFLSVTGSKFDAAVSDCGFAAY